MRKQSRQLNKSRGPRKEVDLKQATGQNTDGRYQAEHQQQENRWLEVKLSTSLTGKDLVSRFKTLVLLRYIKMRSRCVCRWGCFGNVKFGGKV